MLLQIILTGIFYVWMFLVLWLLWRNSLKTQELQRELYTIAQKNANSAHVEAESNRQLVELLRKPDTS